MFSTVKELTICPRCGSNNIYLIMSLSKEKEISCAQCGFIGSAKQPNLRNKK